MAEFQCNVILLEPALPLRDVCGGYCWLPIQHFITLEPWFLQYFPPPAPASAAHMPQEKLTPPSALGVSLIEPKGNLKPCSLSQWLVRILDNERQGELCWKFSEKVLSRSQEEYQEDKLTFSHKTWKKQNVAQKLLPPLKFLLQGLIIFLPHAR